jgi:hypothetical protein
MYRSGAYIPLDNLRRIKTRSDQLNIRPVVGAGNGSASQFWVYDQVSLA